MAKIKKPETIEERNERENRLDPSKLSAAQFKRRFHNKAAQGKSAAAVAVRTHLGTMKNVSKDKARLRNTWENRGDNPGDYHKPERMNGSVLTTARLSAHIRTTV